MEPQQQTYFERPQSIALILGSFFALCLPLALLQLVPNFLAWVPYAILLEVVGLGTTHFFITLAVYLRAENLDYFRSSPRNLLVYVAVPLLIFAFFASSEAWHWSARFPQYAPYVLLFVRFCDFFHVGRQSAGMLQIWKRGLGLPERARIGEQILFVGLACLQWQTFFLGGRFRGDSLYASLPASALCVLFVVLAAAHARHALKTRRVVPLCYLTLQALCAASAVYDTRLYLTALAMHYVEYHVIMAPRLFRTPPATTRRLDRAFGVVRGRAWLFYAALGALVIAFELRSYVQSASPTTTFVVHVFDGVFVVHYFLEAFLWKFRNPYYQRTLAPLYFAPASRVAATESPRPARSRTLVAVRESAVAVVVGAIVLAGVQRAAGGLGLQRRAIDPMLADSHLRWGVQFAEDGDLTSARSHFAEAVRRAPGDPRAQQLLEWVDAHLPH